MSWSEGSVVHINRGNAMQFNSGAKKRKLKSDLHSVQVPTNIQQIILNAVFCQSMSFWDSVPGIRLICCLFGQFFVYNDICRTYPSTKKALSLNCHDRRSASLMSVVSSHKWKSLRRICNPSHPSSIIILLILLLIAMVIMVRGVLTQQASPRQFWNYIGKVAWPFTFLVKKNLLVSKVTHDVAMAPITNLWSHDFNSLVIFVIFFLNMHSHKWLFLNFKPQTAIRQIQKSLVISIPRTDWQGRVWSKHKH